jgi:hypothetical protein
MAGKGGARENAGRKSVEEESKVKNIILNALKKIYSVTTDEQAKENLIITLMDSQKGQIFISEHLFGKPKETVETTHNINQFDIKEMFKVGTNK